MYLDQNIISNIAKAFNPDLQRTKMEPHVQQRCIDLFHKLDRLRRMQLIVCPSSIFHKQESFANEQLYKPLKAVYKRLANFIEFYELFDIQSSQVIQVAKHHIESDELPFIDDPQTVINGKVNSWEQVSMKALFSDYDWKSEYGDEMRKQNEESDKEFQSIYEKWKRGDKTIEERIEEESKGFGDSVRKAYGLYFMKMALVQSGMPPPPEFAEQIDKAWDDHPYIHLVDAVHDLFTSGSLVSSHLDIRQAIDFIAGDDVRHQAPSIKIEPLLWATLANEAAAKSGRKETIDTGDPNDISVIANLLPYCDAVFIDNAWRGRLSDNPAAKEVKKYRAQVYSSKTMDKMMQYLDNIEKQAPSDVLNAVKEVYGEISEENPLDYVHLY